MAYATPVSAAPGLEDRVEAASETSFGTTSETALDAVNCGDPAATVGLGERVVVPLVLIGVGEGKPTYRALELVAPAG